MFCITFNIETVSLSFFQQRLRGLWTPSTSIISLAISNLKSHAHATILNSFPHGVPRRRVPPRLHHPDRLPGNRLHAQPCHCRALQVVHSLDSPSKRQTLRMQNYFCGGSLYSLTSHFSVGLLPYFSISAIWSSSSLRKNKYLLHSTKTFRLKTWGRLLFPQGWLALYQERVVFFGGRDKQIFTGNLFFWERNKSVFWQNLILDKDGENGHFLKTCHLEEQIKKRWFCSCLWVEEIWENISTNLDPPNFLHPLVLHVLIAVSIDQGETN